jgi:DNA-binding MarR family transcriptional regulator
VPLSNIEIDDQSSLLLRLEYQVLKSIKVKSKTEKKIARQLGVNVSIISQVITGLMLKGFVERTRERRMLFYSEYFSTTMDGLLALEANSATIMHPWSRVLFLCRDIANRMLIPLASQSLAVRLGIGAVKTTYRLAKFTFK